MDALLAAITGKCPACHRGDIYKSFLVPHALCPVCSVRFERWEGSWTIPVVMGYGAGAIFAIVLGIILFRYNGLEGASVQILSFSTLIFTALFYPVCKNISFGLLYLNGFIYPDPPRLVKDLDPNSTTASHQD
jgi:uncharacterized protein (DUF983 family)